jgi:hypothetical protein
MALLRDAPGQGQTGFEGEVAGLSLPDLIQLNARNRFSGRFAVENDGQQGLIFFRDGEIVHAERGSLQGEEAFREILHWPAGRFRVEPDVITARRTIQKSCEHLILDALRALDEHGSRAAPQAAPARDAFGGAAPQPKAASSRAALDSIRGVAGVADAVLLTRGGKRLGNEGYEAEVLAGQAAFLAMFGVELSDIFQAGELRFASVQGSAHHLLLYATRSHYLGVSAHCEAVIGVVDAGIRSALTETQQA